MEGMTLVVAVGIVAAGGTFIGASAGLWFGGKMLVPALTEAFKILEDQDAEILVNKAVQILQTQERKR